MVMMIRVRDTYESLGVGVRMAFFDEDVIIIIMPFAFERGVFIVIFGTPVFFL